MSLINSKRLVIKVGSALTAPGNNGCSSKHLKNIANFIQLDENLILDFSKKEDVFEDVFIRFIGENENIVFAKKARIIKEPKKFIFNLSKGFKLSFMKNKIEKLEFENYKLNFPLKNENNYNNYDKNTLT